MPMRASRVSTFFLLLPLLLAVVACGTNAGKNTACGNSGEGKTGGVNSGLEVLYSAPLSDLLNTSITATIDPNTGAFNTVLVNTVPFSVAAASQRWMAGFSTFPFRQRCAEEAE